MIMYIWHEMAENSAHAVVGIHAELAEMVFAQRSVYVETWTSLQHSATSVYVYADINPKSTTTTEAGSHIHLKFVNPPTPFAYTSIADPHIDLMSMAMSDLV
jgi:hypothetical protein